VVDGGVDTVGFAEPAWTRSLHGDPMQSPPSGPVTVEIPSCFEADAPKDCGQFCDELA